MEFLDLGEMTVLWLVRNLFVVFEIDYPNGEVRILTLGYTKRRI